MAKSKRSKIYNLIFIIVIVLLIIPQTRQPIQVVLNKGLAMVVKPSVIDTSERIQLKNYNWQLKNLNGTDFNFSAAEGKVVVLNFWATWCPPCIAEMPSLEKLYQDYSSNDDVVFLFVSNEDSDKLHKFMMDKVYNFPVYQPLTPYPSEFKVSSIPRTFIIDKNGAIVIDKSGAADWHSDKVINTIDELLKAF
ncbi:TlpA disulfide reductase family protein [Psychroserpens sp. SPM9]|uniref:TlpA family protein disulfide reductase n=1 Tax=Psychroserpens sp. SPM9 TaxID=2975598 RepID=UPI0021A92599|nr:TlpA disulfide reductase family protein [Psychroserpens sp. SPM9]MDG5493048.1 TlpA disulfide reductase family protein [Psychroserpens sp. SPM9]